MLMVGWIKIREMRRRELFMIKVMIVDDEPYIRQGIQILINWVQYGFEICGEASNGKEAIELMKGMNVDLVITDIKMPEMNGIELLLI
jgi:two-component system response regulator YesN